MDTFLALTGVGLAFFLPLAGFALILWALNRILR